MPTPAPLSASAAAVLCASFAAAQSYPSGFAATDLIDTSVSGASGMALAPDGRVYFAQHSGEVRVWDPATGLVPSNFYVFNVQYAGERGLIGIAVDPNWSSNHYIYCHYSRASPSNGAVIKRLTASAANPNVVVVGSEVTLLDLGNYPTTLPEHVGGGMGFGPDGKLYVGVGEVGNNASSQVLANPWGKFLRLNPDPANPIPTDNPASFAGIAGSPTGNNRIIWAVGFRNPFSFAFHPVTGRLFINEVGENDWEEINEGVAGSNYGWPDTEGDFTQASFPNFTRPFFTYAHGGAGPVIGQCIVGGAFYHPAQHTFPTAYTDQYFFGDYVSGWVRRINPVTKAVTTFATGIDMVVDIETDAQGRLLILCDGAPARLVRVSYTAALAPQIIAQPVPQAVAPGGTAGFSVYAAASPVPSYRWRRNTVQLSDGPGIAGSATATLTLTGVDCTDEGVYDCVVTNTSGSATSSGAMLSGASNCYANCDCSEAQPILNVADFTCFLQKYAAGNPGANCDASTAPPTLNVADFTCFLTVFAAGCR